jgi:pimeloyl-ACP methyl ester carboxylesterase
VIATRSISIKKSGWDRRVTSIMVLVGGCSLFSGRLVEGRASPPAACSTSTVKDAAHHRVVVHDRRGHGPSSPSATGNDMDTYAADVAAVTVRTRL